MSSRVAVTFLPSAETVWVSPGATVLAAARSAGVHIAASCASRGTCGECGVRVVEGQLSPVEAVEKRGLTRAPRGVRLACQARVTGPVTVQPVISVGSCVQKGVIGDSARFVAGVDLGTTSVSAVVVDSTTGREAGRATVSNLQAAWGADVLSRLSASIEGGGLQLRTAAERSIESALNAAAAEAVYRVDRLVIAGNTAMSSLLAGEDVTPLATYPFAVPRVSELAVASDSTIRDLIADRAGIDVVPPLASFVGGDVLAGVVALGISTSGPPAMLVDIGTNAEIVLSTRGTLFVASAAAGPAFEGRGVSCGGAAAPGAVKRVELSGDIDVELETVGGVEARWFSGAGLVSALAMLKKIGHLDTTGLLSEPGPLSARFSRNEQGVLGVDLGCNGVSLWLSQLDIRALQLAKAAVRSAISIVLKRANLNARKLDVLYIAGAFGGALDPDDLVALGIVPRKTREIVRSVGNSSLTGAAMLALDGSCWEAAHELAAGNVQHVDLASDADFNRMLMEGVALEPYSA